MRLSTFAYVHCSRGFLPREVPSLVSCPCFHCLAVSALLSHRSLGSRWSGRYMCCKYLLPICSMPFHFLSLSPKEQMLFIFCSMIYQSSPKRLVLDKIHLRKCSSTSRPRRHPPFPGTVLHCWFKLYSVPLVGFQ